MYDENKYSSIITGLLLLALLIFIMSLQGCTTIETMRDPDFNQGCKVVEGEAKLGALNQQGVMVVCKLKCSKDLPENIVYKYDNPRTGCHVSIGGNSVNR